MKIRRFYGQIDDFMVEPPVHMIRFIFENHALVVVYSSYYLWIHIAYRHKVFYRTLLRIRFRRIPYEQYDHHRNK